MMKFGLSSGSFEISDDNQAVVSEDIAKQINDNYEQPDNEDNKKPELTIKD